MTQTKEITCEGLKKVYGKVVAVEDVSLEVEKGEMFGLIGPDGAGKTTLFRMLTTLILPDAGHAKVHGLDVVKDYRKIRNHIGYMPGRFSLYQDLSVEENLTFFATLFGMTIKDNYELIKDIYIQIEPFKDRKAGALSGGMKQKLALSCALIHKPDILFLDEPTTGVDPVSRKEFWQILKGLKSQGITVIVSTPYMDEAAMCDRIAFIQLGHILSIDTPATILQKYPSLVYEVSTSGRVYYTQKALLRCDKIKDAYVFGEKVHAVTTEEVKKELEDHLTKEGLTNIEISKIMPTIEDYFIKLLK